MSTYWNKNDLEKVAYFMWTLALREGMDGHCKHYDPLDIEMNEDGSGIAHSYVMDLKDGGRHHPFNNLDELASDMMDEFVLWFKEIFTSKSKGN